MEQVEQPPEATWHPSSTMDVNDEHHPSNLSSTPPILRRRGRKRENDEEQLDQVMMTRPNFRSSRDNGTKALEWRLDSDYSTTPVKELPFSPSEVDLMKAFNVLNAAFNALHLLLHTLCFVLRVLLHLSFSAFKLHAHYLSRYS